MSSNGSLSGLRWYIWKHRKWQNLELFPNASGPIVAVLDTKAESEVFPYGFSYPSNCEGSWVVRFFFFRASPCGRGMRSPRPWGCSVLWWATEEKRFSSPENALMHRGSHLDVSSDFFVLADQWLLMTSSSGNRVVRIKIHYFSITP